ncbi:uncharacterized protein PHACADRAFT_246143 [Phanerochaete carnosa HHB-10118-sp]|uniref:Uncharacterized protein n=1 Tax=Phanerochaete carnosa (strain HHB-10118-sp) TaxID=650164 RepID=K5XBD2_PHACS|nr:uncharacterized protein PHACADRAFT_246143 [Phanerochaete carnosa HHB-10118-sp]EKM60272.1 hypothetical protein PHACADRAFT_246143 [Phanerochaete carnosa HHB-10118-sp]
MCRPPTVHLVGLSRRPAQARPEALDFNVCSLWVPSTQACKARKNKWDVAVRRAYGAERTL